jgi:hypothetical protein
MLACFDPIVTSSAHIEKKGEKKIISLMAINIT